MESIRTLNISKTKMFGARENDCHSWDESGMWLVMMSASVFRTNHNLSQDTTLSNLLILAICRTLLANKLSSSANLFVPKTSKMANDLSASRILRGQSDYFFIKRQWHMLQISFCMWIFEKKNFICTLNITTDPAYSTKRKVKSWDKKKKG